MDKDYYKILRLPYNADEKEIKKSYRELAMKFHPDKNEGNPLAEDHFKELQEAYAILSNPGRRSAYNQQRWYHSSNRKQHDSMRVNADSILHKCKALNLYITTINGYHINRSALNTYILDCLSSSNLLQLNKENDRSVNETIITEVLKSTRYLPYKNVHNICGLLRNLAGDDHTVIESINNYLEEKKYLNYRDKFMPLIVLIISLLICIFIYYVSNTGQ